ncbi:SIS domain-containing protein [Nitrospirillum sp. BR 11752]|uniref:SIS domain-containing protein n=1 Tax=Nitrospirillum sp. BR 11752 TaxID=3104293 RepID=UPI002EBECA5B|nr:SIS domain-containing protein [Nitrospirillum sp. BR 11752]
MIPAPPPASPTVPLMALEAAESGAAAARQIARTAPLFRELGARLRALKPKVVVTCARGSSDHAAAYGKYLIETRLGVPVASVGPSVVSLYNAPLAVDGALFVAVSQSGRSPDLLRLAEAAKAGGALVVGFVNDETSPLAALADVFIPLCAGPERSVAATKSYLTACVAFLQLVAHWQEDAGLADTVARVPGWLDQAVALDWYPALRRLELATGLYVLGRGIGSGAAAEIALKCKETCRLHAEAFSAAEVVHGPFALVGPGFPILALTQDDVTAAVTRDTLAKAAALGAPILATETGIDGVEALPVVAGLPAEVGPLAAVASFYRAIHRVARARGLDPDVPPNLRKVTETV